jgi:hypothetical protein
MLTIGAKIVVLLVRGMLIFVVRMQGSHFPLFFCPFQRWFWTGVDERTLFGRKDNEGALEMIKSSKWLPEFKKNSSTEVGS